MLSSKLKKQHQFTQCCKNRCISGVSYLCNESPSKCLKTEPDHKTKNSITPINDIHHDFSHRLGKAIATALHKQLSSLEIIERNCIHHDFSHRLDGQGGKQL